jgi:hypothetical protein
LSGSFAQHLQDLGGTNPQQMIGISILAEHTLTCNSKTPSESLTFTYFDSPQQESDVWIIVHGKVCKCWPTTVTKESNYIIVKVTRHAHAKKLTFGDKAPHPLWHSLASHSVALASHHIGISLAMILASVKTCTNYVAPLVTCNVTVAFRSTMW